MYSAASIIYIYTAHGTCRYIKSNIIHDVHVPCMVTWNDWAICVALYNIIVTVSVLYIQCNTYSACMHVFLLRLWLHIILYMCSAVHDGTSEQCMPGYIGMSHACIIVCCREMWLFFLSLEVKMNSMQLIVYGNSLTSQTTPNRLFFNVACNIEKLGVAWLVRLLWESVLY